MTSRPSSPPGSRASKLVGFAAVWLITTFAAIPAASQTIDADDLAKFVAYQQDRIRDVGSSDWDDLLYAEAAAGRTTDEAIAHFAARIGVSQNPAREYASVIIAKTVPDGTCGNEPVWPARCTFAPGQALYERAATLAPAERSGQLLIALGKNAPGTWEDPAGFVRLARLHPAANAIFARLAARTHDPHYLLAMAATGPLTEEAAVIVSWGEVLDYRVVTHDEAWRIAFLEAAEQSEARRGGPIVVRAALAQMLIRRKLALGLIDDAVADYYRYPVEIRMRLPLPVSACLAVTTSCGQDDGYALSDEIAAALWVTGHLDDARRLLLRETTALGRRRSGSERRYLALTEAMSLIYSADDLFRVYIEGHLRSEAASGTTRSVEPAGLIDIDTAVDGPGWFFQVRRAGTAVRRVIASRLRQAGYEEMAADLDAWPVRPTSFPSDPLVAAVAEIFPRTVAQRHDYWDARIDAISGIPNGEKTGTVRVSIRELPRWWTERELPQSIAAWRDTDAAPAVPDDLGLPGPDVTIVRYEERDGERALVYLSSEYELTGGFYGGGLWFARTVNGRWSKPLYLGLQNCFPYAVTAGSRLPLLEGNRLRIEVRPREIEATTMTFPPVALDVKRPVDSLFLEFDLAVVAFDRDGDGLTDIEERRLGLDFTNPDTDGDGAPDGGDPLPLVPYRATDGSDDGMVRTIVSEFVRQEIQPGAGGVISTLVTRDDAAGIGTAALPRTHVLVATDPAMFATVATSSRLIVYSPADLAALNNGKTTFSPTRIEHIYSSRDGKRHYVSLSNSGGGRSFLVVCETPAACTMVPLAAYMF